MCLHVKFTGKEKKAILDKLPDEFWAWKLAFEAGSVYKGPFFSTVYYAGLNKFRCNKVFNFGGDNYVGGIHLFLKKPPKNSEWRAWKPNDKLIHVKVKKQWVKTVGQQDRLLTITASHAIFPKYCGEKK